MRNEVDHVFIDCGRVGLADRGGHGHNDCLSFEAALDGAQLVTDCGAFVYTASFAERNRFRSTAYHNTPRIDGAEMNRIDPDLLWTLRFDARPDVRSFETGEAQDRFVGAHAGYQRLTPPVTPVRTIALDHATHTLVVQDFFEGTGHHRVEVPLHLAPRVTAMVRSPGVLALGAEGQSFALEWDPAPAWSLEVGAGRVSPSYGVAVPVVRLVFSREGELGPLTVRIKPSERA
jgi:uncharacterized heparinase superfamily protein